MDADGGLVGLAQADIHEVQRAGSVELEFRLHLNSIGTVML